MLSAEEKKIYDFFIKSELKTDDLMYNFIQFGKNVLSRDKSNKGDVFYVTRYIKRKCQEQVMAVGPEEAAALASIYWDAMLLEAPYLFESFVLYMERKRDPAKRFYEPRSMALRTVVEDLQGLEDGKYKFYGLSMPSRVGKAVACDTPVLTRCGWKKHGELTVRDEVVGLDGRFKKILAIHPPCEMEYVVTFADGEKVACHGKHEWRVAVRNTKSVRDIETEEMFRHYKEKDGHCKYSLPLREPMVGEERALDVDPYTLGVWLGDGRSTNPDVCGPESDYAVIQKIIDNGYEISWKTTHKTTGVRYYGIKGLRRQLQRYGMCHSRRTALKRIPEEYLTASIQQRLELLAGLLDTDGYLDNSGRRYQFSTTSEQLRDGVASLANGFGWRVSVTRHEPRVSSSGVHGRKPCYIVSFNPTMYIPCQLKRKQLHSFSKQRKIGIERIEKISGSVEGNCITVEGGVYCVGAGMKPTHNSTICLLFLTWIACKRPNSHSALGGHSGFLAKGFHKEMLNFITSDEYAFAEVYDSIHPGRTIVRDKSADEYTITLDRPDRFATVTCRGIDGTWTGAVDVSADGYLYVDDLVRDRAHSLSPTRMEGTFQEYLNKMVDRKNDGARELMVGTLWNVMDPLEKMRKAYDGAPGYFFRRIPALDGNDESNFAYKANGFSTAYYREMRDRLDKAEWEAKYQQRPFVREGLLFPEDELRYFNGVLPEGDSRVVAAVDIAWGGGDRVSMPIGREYGNGDVYIFDWVFNAGPKEVTMPIVAGKIMENEIRVIRFEGDQGGELYCDNIDKLLQASKYKCSCSARKAPKTMEKMSKIMAYSGDIKRNFVFLEPKKYRGEEDGPDTFRYKRSKEYSDAMDELVTFAAIGKNPHDDAVDGLTQLDMFIENPGVQRKAVITGSYI